MNRCIAVALVLVAGLSSAAIAQGPKKQSQKPQTDTVVVAGRKVAIDRATGKLRQPTPAESRKLAAALKNMVNRSSDGLTVVSRPNGMKSVDLQGRFQSATVAVRNANGTISEQCVQNEAEAKAALTRGKAKQTAAEVK